MSVPSISDIYRVLAAFDFKDGGIYPANCTKEQMVILDSDAKRIRDRYNALKWGDMTFGEAMTIAKAEYMFWVFSGCPISEEEA